MAGQSVVSVNPARPGEVISRHPVASAAEVGQAVERAAGAQRDWAAVPVPARAEMISRCGEALAGRKAELATLV